MIPEDKSATDTIKHWYKIEDWNDSDILDGNIVLAHTAPNDPYSPNRPELESTKNQVLAELQSSPELYDKIITATNVFEHQLKEVLNVLDQESDMKALTTEHRNQPTLHQKLVILVSRYIAQQQLAHEHIDDMQLTYQELLHFVQELYKNHIPLYDLAFSEWDALRASGRTMLEVYIGRDSAYAYIARRACNIAHGREPEEGIRYLVFPRIFTQGLSSEEKSAYLRDCRIQAEDDPVIFDLCYNGTIPEAILKTLGFNKEETNKRIFLLSAKRPERQFQSIPDSCKNIVVDLQYSPKMEERAIGILHDPKTGKIKYIAKATSPKHQFLYLVLEFILTTHYLQNSKL